MKYWMPVALLLLSSTVTAEEPTTNSVTDTTKSVVSGIVKFGKDLLKGADEGVNEGRKTGQSQDDALIVDNGEDLTQLIEVKYLGAKVVGDLKDHVAIELGFKNPNEKPVRLINLQVSENVIIIDADGYAMNLESGLGNPSEVTVPSKAGKKQTFTFKTTLEYAKEIRLYGKNFSK